MAKVSDIQSRTQKPQQFKPIFLHTALTAVKLVNLVTSTSGQKQKEQKGGFICLRPFLSCMKTVTPTRASAEQAWGQMFLIIRLCYDTVGSETPIQIGVCQKLAWANHILLNLSLLGCKMRTIALCTRQAAEQIQCGTRSDSVL